MEVGNFESRATNVRKNRDDKELKDIESMSLVTKRLLDKEKMTAHAKKLFKYRYFPQPEETKRSTSILVTGYEEEEESSKKAVELIRQQSMVVIESFLDQPSHSRVFDRLTSSQHCTPEDEEQREAGGGKEPNGTTYVRLSGTTGWSKDEEEEEEEEEVGGWGEEIFSSKGVIGIVGDDGEERGGGSWREEEEGGETLTSQTKTYDKAKLLHRRRRHHRRRRKNRHWRESRETGEISIVTASFVREWEGSIGNLAQNPRSESLIGALRSTSSQNHTPPPLAPAPPALAASISSPPPFPPPLPPPSRPLPPPSPPLSGSGHLLQRSREGQEEGRGGRNGGEERKGKRGSKFFQVNNIELRDSTDCAPAVAQSSTQFVQHEKRGNHESVEYIKAVPNPIPQRRHYKRSNSYLNAVTEGEAAVFHVEENKVKNEEEEEGGRETIERKFAHISEEEIAAEGDENEKQKEEEKEEEEKEEEERKERKEMEGERMCEQATGVLDRYDLKAQRKMVPHQNHSRNHSPRYSVVSLPDTRTPSSKFYTPYSPCIETLQKTAPFKEKFVRAAQDAAPPGAKLHPTGKISAKLPREVLEDEGFQDYLFQRSLKPSRSAYVSYKIAKISEKIDFKYSKTLDQALDSIFHEVMTKEISWEKFSAVCRKLLFQGEGTQDGLFMIPAFARKLLEFLPKMREQITSYTQMVFDEYATEWLLNKGGWVSMGVRGEGRGVSV